MIEAGQHFIFEGVETIDYSQYKGWLARTFGIATRTTEFLVQEKGGKRCYDRFIAFEKKDGAFDIFFKDEEFTDEGKTLMVSKLTRRDGAQVTSENIDECMKILGKDITYRQIQAHQSRRYGAF